MWHNSIAAQMELVDALSITASELDKTGEFPSVAFKTLHGHGLVGLPPLADNHMDKLLQLLATIGRGDLNVGRIYEGHVNALWLIRTYGTSAQREFYNAQAVDGALFGVWNTDLPGSPLYLDKGILHGAKNFASGIDGLNYALVTISPAEGRRLIIVPVEQLTVDHLWWKPMGMRASGSHIASFEGIKVDAGWILGEVHAYVGEPWFSGGAIRFAAVQTGGMHAILDITIEHLRRTRRCDDPYQRQRLARIGIAVETAYAWLKRAAAAWTEASDHANDMTANQLIAIANATRAAVEMAAMDVLTDAERAVGAAGFNAPHPLERRIRDLRTYLRQPNPDGALAMVGTAIAAGQWLPGKP